MATFFKDFGKEQKDLFTKNTAEGKGKVPVGFAPLVWKVESKLKTTRDAPIVVNPVADEKGLVVNVEHQCCPEFKTKVAFKPSFWAAKPTFTYEAAGRKVELTVGSLEQYRDFEVVAEDKQRAYTASVKVVPAAATLEGSLPVANGITVGGSVEVPITGSFALTSWSAGVRYAYAPSAIFYVTTKALKSFTFGDYIEVPGFKLNNKAVFAGMQVDYDLAKRTINFAAGLGGKVPGCPCDSSWKAKIDSALNVSLTWFADIAGWKVQTTADVSQRSVGVLITRE